MSVSFENKEIEVIDAHVHTFPDAIAPKAIGKLAVISGITPSTDGTVFDTVRLMDEASVDHALLLNIATAPKQQHTINNCANKLSKKMGDRFIPFGSVHFAAPDALDELDRIHTLGLKGIKLHPDYQGFMIDDKALFPIYEKCEALNLSVSFHTGWDCYSPNLIHARPEASRRVHRRFPKLKMILAHFGGLKCWDEVEKFLIGEDVYLDTAMCATFADKKQIERMIREHGADRVLLGSDCPWENPQKSIQFILSMNLTIEEKEKILSKNVKRLLGI